MDGLILLFTFIIGLVYDVAQTSDGGISFKALSVMSLKCPTVAFLLSPVCDVVQTSDCGISLSPLCGVT